MTKTHGDSKSPEYRSWLGMKERCHNPRDKDFALYGGRGIVVCDRWRTSYENFLADMGRRPTLKHSIDRRDSDGNYELENCRWATRREQSRNSRRCRLDETKVRAIRVLVASGFQAPSIASWFGISVNHVLVIARGKAWRGVEHPSRSGGP